MAIPSSMSGVDLTGQGGPEKLAWRDDLPVPEPGPDVQPRPRAPRPGGRRATSGAIAAPAVGVDLGTLHPGDLTSLGGTRRPGQPFGAPQDMISAGRVRPMESRTYPLRRIEGAQADLQSGRGPGKIVLLPDPEGAE